MSPATSGVGCPECGETVNSGDLFCESCGAQLATPPPNDRDHVTEQPATRVAGVSDRGKTHPRNEDAQALAVTGTVAVLVVCDGVSTTANSDRASAAAAAAARDLLVAAAGGGPPTDRAAHWTSALQAATAAADRAVAEVGGEATTLPGGTPSCTLVAAVAEQDLISLAWLGDSRAYWLPAGGVARQLTVDDSWATAQIAAGVPREVAEAAPNAHAITAWLGADNPNPVPSTHAETIAAPGWLLVCSDGLWNYCSDPAALGTVIDGIGATEPLALAEGLVGWANDQGGHDNITVALAWLEPTRGAH